MKTFDINEFREKLKRDKERTGKIADLIALGIVGVMALHQNYRITIERR